MGIELRSGSNYFITAGGDYLFNPAVNVVVNQTILAPYGFSIQMNCQPAPNYFMNWQQYGFTFDTNKTPPVVQWWINLWPTNAYNETFNPQPGTLVVIF